MSDFSRIELSYAGGDGRPSRIRSVSSAFPAASAHVWIGEGAGGAGAPTIDARIYSSDAVMDLLLLNDALRRVAGEARP